MFAALVLAACSSSGPRPDAPGAADTRVAPDANASESNSLETVAGASADAGTAAGVVSPIEVPEPASAAFARALAAMTAEDWLTARLELEQLAAEFPGFPGPLVNLGIIHRRDGRAGDARAALDAALAIAPDHAAANNELGILLREQGDFAGAEAAYRRAIAGDPGYALAHYNLGVLLDLYLRRESDALEQYEIFQSLLTEPDPEVDRWIVDLRRRLGMPAEPVQLARGDGP